MQMKRRFAQTAAVLFCGVLLYAFGIRENGRQGQFTDEKEKQERFYESLKPQIQRADEEAGIVYVQETAPFSESVLALIRQCAVHCLQARGMPSYLEPYKIDSEKGRERFLQLVGEEYFQYAESCDEVYYYVDADGNENFLVSEYWGGSLGRFFCTGIRMRARDCIKRNAL